jgi:hypothetical protein
VALRLKSVSTARGVVGVVVGAILAIAVLAEGSSATEVRWDETETPALCPTGPLTGHPSSQYDVQKWAQPAGDEVRFDVATYNDTTAYQTVFGYGWYVPAPTTTSTPEGIWDWIADNGQPAVRAECFTRRILGIHVLIVRLTGAYQGYAWPTWQLGPPGTEQTVVRGGGGGEGIECWELVMYGYDQYGQYWEIILAQLVSAGQRELGPPGGAPHTGT